MIKGHGGNIYELARNMGCSPSDIIDMSSNTNPLGPPPGLLEHLTENLHVIYALPEVDGRDLLEAFARHHQISVDRVLTGNGTTQFIFSLPQALKTKKALILGPTYADYEDSCQIHKIDYQYEISKESALFQPDIMHIENCLADADTVFICNPNNPTSNLIKREDLLKLCKTHPRVRFLIDESYLPFTDRYDEATMIYSDLANVVVLHSFSKIFCVPGLRLGFLVASPENVEKVRYLYQPWSVNSLAQNAGRFLLDHVLIDDGFIRETRAFIANEHELLVSRFKNNTALKLFSSITSYVLIKIKDRFDAAQLCSIMANNRILLRNCTNFKGLSDRFVRISLKGPEINAKVADKLLEIFD